MRYSIKLEPKLQLSQHGRISKGDDLIHIEIIIQNAQFY